MDYIKFTNTNNLRSVRLTVDNSCVIRRTHNDDLVGWDANTVTVEYHITATKYKLYLGYEEKIDSALITHNLIREPGIKLLKSSLLFYAIEFDRRLAELIKDKARYARLDNMIQFLKLARSLSPVEKQKVQVSFLIKNQPFALEDQATLSEAVINKLSGMITETVRHGYPELWNIYFKDNKRLKKEKATAESIFRNVVVAEVTRQIITYLNKNSVRLANKRIKTGTTSITSEQGNFIYNLLTELDLYRPTRESKDEVSSKKASYHGLRKLLARH